MDMFDLKDFIQGAFTLLLGALVAWLICAL